MLIFSDNYDGKREGQKPMVQLVKFSNLYICTFASTSANSPLVLCGRRRKRTIMHYHYRYVFMEVTFNHNRQLLIRYAAALIKILSYNKYISEFQTYMDYKDCANKD